MQSVYACALYIVLYFEKNPFFYRTTSTHLTNQSKITISIPSSSPPHQTLITTFTFVSYIRISILLTFYIWVYAIPMRFLCDLMEKNCWTIFIFIIYFQIQVELHSNAKTVYILLFQSIVFHWQYFNMKYILRIQRYNVWFYFIHVNGQTVQLMLVFLSHIFVPYYYGIIMLHCHNVYFSLSLLFP